MTKKRAKFKDTNFGKRLIKAIPDAAGFVGDLLPDEGVFGVAKRIIDKSTLTTREKSELSEEAIKAELSYLSDAQNARQMEMNKDVSEHSSWLSKNIHEIIAIAVVIPWVSLMVYSFIMEITNPGFMNLESIKTLFGIFGVTNVVSLILGYLYGRSRPQK